MIQAVLFDLDGTLINRDATVDQFVTDQHSRLNIDVPVDIYRSRFCELDRGGYGDKNTVWSTLVTEFGIRSTSDELLADFRRNASRFSQLFPGTKEILRELRARGYRLGIVTNGTVELQDAKIQVTGLSTLVDVVLISEHEKLRKPDSEIFVRTAKRLGVDVSECLFVGDNPRADVVGAHEAGMKVAWFQVNQTWPAELAYRPVHVVSNAGEIIEIVSQVA